MSAEEFGGIGFAPGVVRGTRSFGVDKLGRLTGVSYKQVWKPGENVAECRREDESRLSMILRADLSRYISGMSFGGGGVTIPTAAPHHGPTVWVDQILETSPATSRAAKEAAERAQKAREEKEREEEERRKRDPLADCSHGFYGYYDGSNDYYKSGYVMGVIEGYGETVIGTRGFRCMKARIVALRIPKHVPDRLRAMILRNYKDIPVFESFKAMVAEFPPDDAGSGITPESDPEFWTRTI